MKRFLIGFIALIVGGTIGNFIGAVSLGFPQVNYTMPGGVVLGFFQGVFALTCCQGMCVWLGDNDLMVETVRVGTWVSIGLSVLTSVLIIIMILLNGLAWSLMFQCLSAWAATIPWIRATCSGRY